MMCFFFVVAMNKDQAGSTNSSKMPYGFEASVVLMISKHEGDEYFILDTLEFQTIQRKASDLGFAVEFFKRSHLNIA